MSGKGNVSVFRGRELANALYTYMNTVAVVEASAKRPTLPVPLFA